MEKAVKMDDDGADNEEVNEQGNPKDQGEFNDTARTVQRKLEGDRGTDIAL